MRITLNGESQEMEPGLTVEGLLKSLRLEPKKVAVERNLEIVRRSAFATQLLADGDRIEIVHFIGGG
jgi:thiamine biosynthesis protein ThiS